MEHTRIEPAAPLDGASTDLVEIPPPEPARHDGWTAEKQAEFLCALGATHCVTDAARAVGMSRQSANRLRNRLKGEPFDMAWASAFRRQYDALAEAVVERAIHGVEVPHFYKGELIHTSRRYDERAAVALLALRERLAPKPHLHHAMTEGIAPDDFACLVDRVRYGDEWWEDPEQADDDEA